ncbi:unnamed protein product [Cladocopium goreaui]|uniref:Uncharacterized protein n=1 Tax=Cladocopium goreaui TaxID=2562237 RepID=A0A9P1C1V3_9DINO|nr:unnamed protein product [Cladocopium goreaui]
MKTNGFALVDCPLPLHRVAFTRCSSLALSKMALAQRTIGDGNGGHQRGLHPSSLAVGKEVALFDGHSFLHSTKNVDGAGSTIDGLHCLGANTGSSPSITNLEESRLAGAQGSW